MQIPGTQRPSRRRWQRWALRFGLPCALVALGSVWLYKPETQARAIAAAGIAVAALIVFVLTMPGRTEERSRRARGVTPDDPS
ncbi:hypothetical protein ACFV3R_09995 [Streptomyces sp. NPDC059740]|uniref:hypothetical protein n=1 Tax=Streptomyces sp. NPDC059740 TaxID=3346926 RepID=UPI00365E2974